MTLFFIKTFGVDALGAIVDVATHLQRQQSDLRFKFRGQYMPGCGEPPIRYRLLSFILDPSGRMISCRSIFAVALDEPTQFSSRDDLELECVHAPPGPFNLVEEP